MISYIIQHVTIFFFCYQNKYFLVRDVTESTDQLGTLPKYNCPNLRKCKGNFPVPIYGMGQPTRDGLTTMMDLLTEEGYSVSICKYISKIETIYQFP